LAGKTGVGSCGCRDFEARRVRRIRETKVIGDERPEI
jgi:hypothetical protein